MDQKFLSQQKQILFLEQTKLNSIIRRLGVTEIENYENWLEDFLHAKEELDDDNKRKLLYLSTEDLNNNIIDSICSFGEMFFQLKEGFVVIKSENILSYDDVKNDVMFKKKYNKYKKLKEKEIKELNEEKDKLSKNIENLLDYIEFLKTKK